MKSGVSKVPARRDGFRLDFPLDKLQAVRLCMALAESGCVVQLPPQVEPTFRYLARLFPASYRFGGDELPAMTDIEISHAEPRCRVGSIERPLMFPHVIFDRCREKWSASRLTRYAFCGLVTSSRQRQLEGWIRRNFPLHGKHLRVRATPQSRRALLLARLMGGGRDAVRHNHIGLCIYSSARGRRFPEKVWDEAYYDLLATSQFALCPDGDFVWTYRFFEAVLCGAIPVVENSCALYEGFTFYSLSEPAADLCWSAAAAEDNLARARALLTIPRDELNACIAALVQAAEGPAQRPALHTL